MACQFEKKSLFVRQGCWKTAVSTLHVQLKIKYDSVANGSILQ